MDIDLPLLSAPSGNHRSRPIGESGCAAGQGVSPEGRPPVPRPRDGRAEPATRSATPEEGEREAPVKRRRPSQARARSRGPLSLYERMGGAIALRRLVRRFHELMETLPEAEAARAVLHVAPSDLGPKLYEFLSGWLGGPELYTKRHGAPKLKRRHFLVPIGPAQRDGWLLCFRKAAEETITDPAVIEEMMPQVESLAHYLADRS